MEEDTKKLTLDQNKNEIDDDGSSTATYYARPSSGMVKSRHASTPILVRTPNPNWEWGLKWDSIFFAFLLTWIEVEVVQLSNYFLDSRNTYVCDCECLQR
jgi:hypothetical protein